MIRPAAILMALLTVASACGSETADRSEEAERDGLGVRGLTLTGGSVGGNESGDVIPLSDLLPGEQLDAGTYETQTTAKSVTFTIGDGWFTGGQAPWTFSIAREPKSLDDRASESVAVVFYEEVQVPDDPVGGLDDAVWIDSPPDIVDWWESVSEREVLTREPASVAGQRAVKVLDRVGGLPPSAKCDLELCLISWGVLDGHWNGGILGNTESVSYVFGDPGDQIGTGYALTGSSPEFVDLAEDFIDSLIIE